MNLKELIQRGKAIVMAKNEAERQRESEYYVRYDSMWRELVRNHLPWLQDVISNPEVRARDLADNEATYAIPVGGAQVALLHLSHDPATGRYSVDLEGRAISNLDELAEALYLIQEWTYTHTEWNKPTPFFGTQSDIDEEVSDEMQARKRFFCIRTGEREIYVNVSHITDVYFWADGSATIHIFYTDEGIHVEGSENIQALRDWLTAWDV